MVEKRIKGNHHPKWVIDKILQFHDEGMRSKDISKNSKEKIGYKIQQSTICQILKRNGRNAKSNSFRVIKCQKTGKLITRKRNVIVFSNIVPPHNVEYGSPL